MKFDIYHTNNFMDYPFLFEDHASLEIPRRPIATVEAEDLEHAYFLTNSIDQAWYGKKADHVIALYIRSTSVGDVIYNQNEKKAYVVENAGFSEYTGSYKF